MNIAPYKMETALTRSLGITYPIIVAPMFLISNTSMIKEALKTGVTAAFPALNYRTIQKLEEAILDIKKSSDKPFGVNLIVNKSNRLYKKQLEVLLHCHVDYVITSLGSPKDVIEACKKQGIKVFCDVVDLTYAKKVEDLGADALIAVNAHAGGHAGHLPPQELIPLLKQHCSISIISAGGIAKGEHINEALEMGADGVSVGTIFIASEEANISTDYKEALIRYGKKDIIKTTRISGVPLTVINTPYMQKIGSKPHFLERFLHLHKELKKYVKMFITYIGMKKMEKSIFKASYKNVWCAGPSIEYVREVRPIRSIVNQLIEEMSE